MTNGISASVRRVRGSDLAVLEVGPRRLEVLSLGAHLIGLWSPDREGRVDNVVVSMRDVEGSPDVDAYRDPARNPYLGSIVGRYAGGFFIYAVAIMDAYRWAKVRWEIFHHTPAG